MAHAVPSSSLDTSGPIRADRALLRAALEHAAELLPGQGPIAVFVHHNTLHALEDLTFEDAVRRGAELFGCEPYLAERGYRDALTNGRILDRDLIAVLRNRLDAGADEPLFGGAVTRLELRLRWLRHGLLDASGPTLAWTIAEGEILEHWRADLPEDARRRLIERSRHERGAPSDRAHEAESVRALFEECLARCPESRGASTRPAIVRHRDALLAACGVDTDQQVHPTLIRLCAAFLDQGIAYWSMPERSTGFYRAVGSLLGRRPDPPDRWLAALGAEFRRQAAAGMDAEASVLDAVDALGVAGARLGPFVERTLLALRGWAGMFRQLATRPDRVPHAPPCSVLDFVAVRLTLERVALLELGGSALGPDRSLAALLELPDSVEPAASREQRAFALFQLAELAGVTAGALGVLDDADVARVLHELDAFPEIERRSVLHDAFERRHRIGTLDALCGAPVPDVPARTVASFQAVFCLDEREESLRRHLEEVAPECETFGTAGFFGIPMYYRGLDDSHATPLCPVGIQPRHYVEERAVEQADAISVLQHKARRAVGETSLGLDVGSRTLWRGTVLSASLGILAAAPLVVRVAFPSTAARLERLSERLIRARPATRLAINRTSDGEPARAPDGSALLRGFSVEEQADIVERLLVDTGVATRPSSLVLLMGHGSSSLNNPHESAHDCGACGGGRGGPNARAFAAMANSKPVRALLSERGIALRDVTFVGAYHDTCNDDIVVYDADAPTHRVASELANAREALDRARTLHAEERCRRFNAALGDGPAAALEHVHMRANDLAQPRPEYGHATNAVCVIGRRSRTRGLYLDRRAFLTSYDPTQDDDEATILGRIIDGVAPVVAGINLEYYFSYVDPTGYGCGTKLPHNITSLLGVMDGPSSDLRTGLPWQMVEVHEPVRLVLVIETTARRLVRVLERLPRFRRLIEHRWIQLACLDPRSHAAHVYDHGQFVLYEPELTALPEAPSSRAWHGGRKGHLGYARIRATAPRPGPTR